MNQDDEPHGSRFVVQTEREQRTTRDREGREGNGFSLGAVVAVALSAVILTAVVVFLAMNRSNDKASVEPTAVNINANLAARPSAPTPMPTFTPFNAPTPMAQTNPTLPPGATVVIPSASMPNATPSPVTPNLPDDATLQANISRTFLDDPQLGNADIDASVARGKVTLRGKVTSISLKVRAEKLAKTVRGVQSVDDKIIVEEDTSGWQETTPDNPPTTPQPHPTLKKP